MEEKTGKESQQSVDLITDEAERIIPVVEEEVVTGKRKVVRGTVLIEKKIKSEEISVELPVTSEVINIEHVPRNQYLDSRPEIRYEGDTIIIPVMKEVIVSKLLLVEEIRITKETRTDTVTKNITLKKEEVNISRIEKQSESSENLK